jgi:hypothetical protein
MPKNHSSGCPIIRVAPMAGKKPKSQRGNRIRSLREFIKYKVE